MKKDFDARRLDVRRFAEAGAAIEGEDRLDSFVRLIAESGGRGGDNLVRWQGRGEILNPEHVRPQVWLHLDAHARLPLVCQRCLGPVDVEVNVQRSFRFVPDEATAAAEDDEAEEDLLAESRSFDLLELIEDELLMDMPAVPRHEVCPVTLPRSAGDAEFEEAQAQRENPFAVLGRLKGGR